MAEIGDTIPLSVDRVRKFNSIMSPIFHKYPVIEEIANAFNSVTEFNTDSLLSRKFGLYTPEGEIYYNSDRDGNRRIEGAEVGILNNRVQGKVQDAVKLIQNQRGADFVNGLRKSAQFLNDMLISNVEKLSGPYPENLNTNYKSLITRYSVNGLVEVSGKTHIQEIKAFLQGLGVTGTAKPQTLDIGSTIDDIYNVVGLAFSKSDKNKNRRLDEGDEIKELNSEIYTRVRQMPEASRKILRSYVDAIESMPVSGTSVRVATRDGVGITRTQEDNALQTIKSAINAENMGSPSIAPPPAPANLKVGELTPPVTPPIVTKKITKSYVQLV